MDQYSNLFSNPMIFYQHQQNSNFFNNPVPTSNRNTQYYNNYQNCPEESSSSQNQISNSSSNVANTTYASHFAEFASNPLLEAKSKPPKKKKKRSDRVSTTKWPEADATIIREQVAQESELVREQVLIPETADPSKLIVYSLGPRCANPFFCRKLRRKCDVFDQFLREHILQAFKNDLSERERKIFILNNIEAAPTKKKNVYKLQYFLRDYRYNRRLPVCRTLFLNTLSITNHDVRTILKNSQCGMLPSVLYYPPKSKKKPNPNLFFSPTDYGDKAISDYSDDNHFDDFKEEPDTFSDPEDYDPLNRHAIPKDLPGAKKKKNIEDMIKSGEISKISCPEEMGPRCASKRCKTCENFSEERRSLLFSSFWNMMSWRERKDFILKTVICRKPNKTIYANGKSPRQFTYDYSLPMSYNLKDYEDPNVQLIPVCSIMYINTLGIKINVVKRFIKQGPDNFGEIEVEKIIQDPKYLLEAQMQTKNKRRINWKAIQRELRAKGETYFTQVTENNETKFIERAPKKMKARCSGVGCNKSSKRRCSEITEEQREELFRHYWKDLDKQQKKMFICENVCEDSTGRMKELDGFCKQKGKIIELNDSRRGVTFRYFLPVNGEKIQVCKMMFIGTLSLPDKKVRDVIRGSFGLIQNSSFKAGLLNGADVIKEIKEETQALVIPRIKDEDCSEKEDDEYSDAESNADVDTDQLCDDKSSSNEDDSEEEVVIVKKSRGISRGMYKPKVILNQRCSGCKKDCEKIDDVQRDAISNYFWNDLDRMEREAFVKDFITVDKPARCKMIEEAFKKSGSELDTNELSKKCVFKYYLPLQLGGDKIRVCVKMFEGTLSIKHGRIKRIMGSKKSRK